MLDRFVIPLDLSEPSEGVLAWVIPLAKALGQPVVLLSVIRDPDELVAVSGRHGPELTLLLEQHRGVVQRYLDGIKARLAVEGVTAATEVAVARLDGPLPAGLGVDVHHSDASGAQVLDEAGFL